jgi:hypothetical protein
MYIRLLWRARSKKINPNIKVVEVVDIMEY